MKKYLVFMAMVISMLFTGCGDSSISKVEKPIAPTSQRTTATPETKSYAVGDTIRINGVDITVNGVRISDGDKFNKPDNQAFLFVDVTVENVSDRAYRVLPIEFKLYDSESFEVEENRIIKKRGELRGEISPGRKIRGEIVFDIPESSYFDFVYGEILKKGQVIWRVESPPIDTSTSNLEEMSEKTGDEPNEPQGEQMAHSETVEVSKERETRGYLITPEDIARAEDKSIFIKNNFANLIKTYPGAADFKATDKTFVRLKADYYKDSTGKTFVLWVNVNSLVSSIDREGISFSLLTPDDELKPTIVQVDPSSKNKVMTEFDDLTLDISFDLPDGVNPRKCILRMYEGDDHVDLRFTE